MSRLSHDVVMDIMAYADGELEGADRERVEALLASDGDAKNLLAELRGVGDWVGRSAEVHASTHGADGIADAVMAKVGTVGAPIDLAGARAKRAMRMGTVGAVGTVLALAAAVFLLVRDPAATSTGHAGMTSLGADPAPSGRPTYDVLAVLAKKGDAPAVDPMLDPADFSHGELAEYNQFRVLDRKNDTEIAAGSALVVNAEQKLELVALRDGAPSSGRRFGVTLKSANGPAVLSFRVDAPADPRATFVGTGHKFQDGLLVVAFLPRK